MEHPEDQDLERLLRQVKLPQAPLGFEHRVLARLREEREQSAWSRFKCWWQSQSLGLQGGLSTAGAALVIVGSVGVFSQWEQRQRTDHLLSALDAFEQYQQDTEKWPELDLYTWQ